MTYTRRQSTPPSIQTATRMDESFKPLRPSSTLLHPHGDLILRRDVVDGCMKIVKKPGPVTTGTWAKLNLANPVRSICGHHGKFIEGIGSRIVSWWAIVSCYYDKIALYHPLNPVLCCRSAPMPKLFIIFAFYCQARDSSEGQLGHVRRTPTC